MSRLNVGVLSKFTKLASELKSRLPSASINNINTSNSSGKVERAKFKNYDVIVADYELIGPHIYALENIKFLQATSAGADNLLRHVKPEEPLNYPVIRFSGHHFGKMISEYIIRCIVNHERYPLKENGNRINNNWGYFGKVSYRAMYDLTIGVMGIGQIGSRVASTLKFMGAKTLGFGQRKIINKNDFPGVDEYYSTSELPIFLSKCDYIINILPHTKETQGMLNYPALEACRENKPVFINVGRGSISSDTSLLKALETNLLSHAYLDVFNEEPLPENHPFWKSEKVNISSHIAAIIRPQDVAEQFVRTLEMFEKNEVIPWQINFAKGNEEVNNYIYSHTSLTFFLIPAKLYKQVCSFSRISDSHIVYGLWSTKIKETHISELLIGNVFQKT